jgi:hypothetical protein
LLPVASRRAYPAASGGIAVGLPSRIRWHRAQNRGDPLDVGARFGVAVPDLIDHGRFGVGEELVIVELYRGLLRFLFSDLEFLGVANPFGLHIDRGREVQFDGHSRRRDQRSGGSESVIWVGKFQQGPDLGFITGEPG